MNEPEEEADPLGYHVIPGTFLLEMLRRVEAGEKADMVFAEVDANAERVRVCGYCDDEDCEGCEG